MKTLEMGGRSFLRLDCDRRCWENYGQWGVGAEALPGTGSCICRKVQSSEAWLRKGPSNSAFPWILNEAISLINCKLLSVSYVNFIILHL